MDGERFDHLTRRLAEALPRRRLLRRAAGALVGVVLAGRAGSVRAQQTCADCIDRGLACCTYDLGILCRAANQTCCGPILCSEGFACVDGFCVACDSEKKCGDTCCGAEQTCENEECVDACPGGAPRCGGTCCNAEETCDNGQCVIGCPVGVAAQQDGGRRSRCRKKCPAGKLKCDGKCIDPQTDRTHCGGCANADGASCGAGPCCHGQCQAGGSTCCGDQVCSAGEECCGQPKKCCPAGQCCGPGCCPVGQYCARFTAKVGLCCPNGQQDCNKGCCGPGEVCASFRKSVCCPADRPRYCGKTDQCVENRQACK